MNVGDKPYVVLTARVFVAGKQPMIDEVGGEQLPYCVEVSFSQRFVEAAHQGLVLLSCLRHRSFLLLANLRSSYGLTPSMMPPSGLRHIGWSLIHRSS